MNKHLMRWIALLLVPCFLADPVMASAFMDSLSPVGGRAEVRGKVAAPSHFEEEALAARACAFPHSRTLRSLGMFTLAAVLVGRGASSPARAQGLAIAHLPIAWRPSPVMIFIAVFVVAVSFALLTWRYWSSHKDARTAEAIIVDRLLATAKRVQKGKTLEIKRQIAKEFADSLPHFTTKWSKDLRDEIGRRLRKKRDRRARNLLDALRNAVHVIRKDLRRDDVRAHSELHTLYDSIPFMLPQYKSVLNGSAPIGQAVEPNGSKDRWGMNLTLVDYLTVKGNRPEEIEKAARFFKGSEGMIGPLILDVGGGMGDAAYQLAKLKPRIRVISIDQFDPKQKSYTYAYKFWRKNKLLLQIKPLPNLVLLRAEAAEFFHQMPEGMLDYVVFVNPDEGLYRVIEELYRTGEFKKKLKPVTGALVIKPYVPDGGSMIQTLPMASELKQRGPYFFRVNLDIHSGYPFLFAKGIHTYFWTNRVLPAAAPQETSPDRTPQMGKHAEVYEVQEWAGNKYLQVKRSGEFFKHLGELEAYEVREIQLSDQFKELFKGRTQSQDLLQALISTSELDPPDIYLYNDLIEDLFGYAYYTDVSRFITLYKGISQNRIALFHEYGEFLVDAGRLTLELSGLDQLNVTLDGKTYVVKLDPEAQRLAKTDVNDPHYLLRALQHQLFPDLDIQLSDLINQLQNLTATIHSAMETSIFPREMPVNLSVRQREVLFARMAGQRNVKIARILGVSDARIGQLMSVLRRKLNRQAQFLELREMESIEEKFKKPVQALNIKVRTERLLERLGIQTIGQLVQHTREHFSHWSFALKDIEQALSRVDLSLRRAA